MLTSTEMVESTTSLQPKPTETGIRRDARAAHAGYRMHPSFLFAKSPGYPWISANAKDMT
jgi:hypothetical protein